MSENLEKAQWLLALGRHETAAEFLTRELSQNPENPLALVLFAQCQNQMGRPQAAEESARNALRAMPDMAQAYFVLSQSLAKQNKYREAMEVARKAAQIDPVEPDYPAAVASILVNQGKYPTALHYAQHALSLDPLHAWAHNLRAVCFLGLGQIGEATEAAREILTHQPETSLALSIEGLAALDRRQFDQADRLFAEALRLEPSSSIALFGKREVLIRKKGSGRFLLFFFRPQNQYQKIEQATCALFCLGITLGIFVFPSKVPVPLGVFVAIWGLRFTGPWLFSPLSSQFLGQIHHEADWEPSSTRARNRVVTGLLVLGLFLLIVPWFFFSSVGPLLGVAGVLAIQWAWVLSIVFPGGPWGRFFPGASILAVILGIGFLATAIGAQVARPGEFPTQTEWAGVFLGFLGASFVSGALMVLLLGCTRDKP